MAGPPLQPLHIPAGLTVDQSTREEHVAVGQGNLANLNSRLTERLASEKRLGMKTISSQVVGESARSQGRRMFDHNGVPAVITGTHAHLWVEALGKWRSHGRVSEVRLDTIPAPGFFQATVEDVTYANGYYCLTYLADRDDGDRSAVAVIVDAETGQAALAPALFGSAAEVAYVAATSDRYFFVVYCEDANVTAHFIDTQDLAAGWADIAGGAPFKRVGDDRDGAVGRRFAVEQLSDRVAVAYVNDTAGTARITVKTFDQSGVISTATPPTFNDIVFELDLAGRSDDTLWLANMRADYVEVTALSPSTLAVTGTRATLDNLGDSDPSEVLTVIPNGVNTAVVVAQNQEPTDQIIIRGLAISGGGAVVGTGEQIVVNNVWIAARGFHVSGRSYLQVYCSDRNTGRSCAQQQIVTVDITDATRSEPWLRPVVVHSQGTSTRSAAIRAKTVQRADTGVWVTAVNRLRTPSTVSADIALYDFTTSSSWEPAPFQRATFMSGGVVTYLDGAATYEASILFAPPPAEVVTIEDGFMTAAIGYRYILLYEHLDATGAVTKSGLSEIASTASSFEDKKITLNLAPMTVSMRHGSKANTLRIGLYRTADGGKVFYRLDTIPFDGTQSTITYEDTVGDTTLKSREKLFRQPDFAGTAQDRRPPGPLHHLTAYNGFLVGSFGRTLYWTGQPVDGEGAWWNPLFQSSPLDDDITAVLPLDSALAVYTRRSVYLTAGEPPVDNASQGGIGALRRVSSDVGCVDQRSLCATGIGHFFLSDRGLEILTRGQTVEQIGHPVQRTLAANPVVSSAVLDAKNGLVRVTCAESEDGGTGAVSDQGVTLVFDVTLPGWVSVDRLTAVEGLKTSAQSGAFVQQGGAWRYAILQDDGTVWVERDEDDPHAYLDAGWVPHEWEPAFVRAGLQQQARCFNGVLLVERHSDAGLRIELAYGYDGELGGTSSLELKEWTSVETASNGRQFPFRPDDQKPVMRILVKELEPLNNDQPDLYGTGRGFTFVALSFDLVPIGDATRGTPLFNDAARK